MKFLYFLIVFCFVEIHLFSQSLIVTTSGKEINCEIKRFEEDSVRFVADGVELSGLRSSIQSIYAERNLFYTDNLATDTLFLKSGEKLSGVIVSVQNTFVDFIDINKNKKQILQYEKNLIKSIHYPLSIDNPMRVQYLTNIRKGVVNAYTGLALCCIGNGLILAGNYNLQKNGTSTFEQSGDSFTEKPNYTGYILLGTGIASTLSGIICSIVGANRIQKNKLKYRELYNISIGFNATPQRKNIRLSYDF